MLPDGRRIGCPVTHACRFGVSAAANSSALQFEFGAERYKLVFSSNAAAQQVLQACDACIGAAKQFRMDRVTAHSGQLHRDNTSTVIGVASVLCTLALGALIVWNATD